jgi:exodeoxyribonuclease VII small subunit
MSRSDTSRTDAPTLTTLPFEKALAELEDIVRRLERGDVPLEDSIAIYERGEALKNIARPC